MTLDADSDAELGAEVAQAFGLGTPTSAMARAARGVMGQVWRLTTPAGDFAAKQLFAWARGDRFDLEAAITEAAIAGGVATPRIVRTADGTIIAMVRGDRWRMFSWMDLGPELALPLATATAAALGATLAKLHGLGLAAEASEVIPWFTGRRSAEDWRGIEARVRRAPPPWADLLTRALPDIIELTQTAPPAASLGPCVLSHCDLTVGNVWGGAGGLILIDWEHTGAIPPLWELGAVLQAWTLSAGGEVNAAAARATVQGYRDAGGLAPPLLALDIFAGAISAMLNWTTSRLHAALAHADPAERARAVTEVEGLLTRPLSRAGLEAVLAALN